MLKKINFIFLFLVIAPFYLLAQVQEPVKWKHSISKSGEIIFTTTIDPGWHLYDMHLPPGGPNPTTFIFEKVKGVELLDKVTTLAEINTEFDDLFGMNISWYKGNPSFTQKLKIIDAENFNIQGYIDYMTCNDEYCIPCKEEFSFSKKDLPASLINTEHKANIAAVSDSTSNSQQSVDELSTDSTSSRNEPVMSAGTLDWWKPVVEELQNYGTGKMAKDKSWVAIFLLCFGGGFLALLTPCVWPIIPMTVSFFLKRSKSNRKQAVTDAVIYGLSIIIIYLALGLLITILFGASALNELSTNAVFNLIFFALLILFAVSFFGAFELTLPSSWTNKIDNKAETTTGFISIFFMAFTLVLVSFSCTGPIIGGLLVQAASMGSITGPAIGMLGFGLALAIPFAFFAIFPSLLQNLPKSGGWLNSVKVVLGFLELALALKFLSVADLAYGWRILDREVFLVLWIIIFALLGFYLLGKIKFAHDSDLKHLSVARLFLAIISFSFTIYMIPGLWGAPLKVISAFSPPLYTQDFNLYDGEVHPKFYDYDEGMEYAAKHGKPVMVDFTGFGCVNCREMEASVWSDPRVKGIIDNDYVLISLYVDDKAKLPETVEIEEYGKTTKLRTIGDKWSYLQRHKFGANAQPYYVLLNNHGQPIGPWRAYNKDVDEYIRFLQEGSKNFSNR
ncbi:MAG: thioredoxin family protein [Dysgonamonadaceae bacterium]|jgi:thiol:disulfide interchange protein DsbD|nr:thioredoxin family protein [Dysgonamonadaceae bacterium]